MFLCREFPPQIENLNSGLGTTRMFPWKWSVHDRARKLGYNLPTYRDLKPTYLFFGMK